MNHSEIKPRGYSSLPLINYNIEDKYEDSFKIKQTRTVYTVVEFGDGYYYGNPIATFLSEESAHIFKSNKNNIHEVIESSLIIADKDNYMLESDNILN